jgi:hypothetical protein
MFSILAVDFIVSHELWHVLGGHLRWYLNRNAGLMLAEVREQCPGDEGIASQALEMQADAFAVWMSLRKTLHIARERVAPPHVPLVVTNPVQAVEATLLCALVMVGTFLGEFSPPPDWSKLTHPPLGVRHGMNILEAGRTLLHMGEEEAFAATTGSPEWGTSFGCFALQHVWTRIGNPEWPEVGRLSFGPIGVEHMENVRRKLVELGPELDRFAHFGSRGRSSARPWNE